MNERFDVIVTILELIGTAAFGGKRCADSDKKAF